MQKLLLRTMGILSLILCLGATSDKSSSKISGLYKMDPPSMIYFFRNDYLLFRNNGRVGLLRYHQIKGNDSLRRDFKEFSTWTKYRIDKDSIFFQFDSIFSGLSTMRYEVFGKSYSNSRPNYQRRKIVYKGVMRAKEIQFKVFVTSRFTSLDPFGGGIGHGWVGNDTMVIQRFVLCD